MKSAHMKRLFLASLASLLAGCAGTRPATLGAHDGRLAPCPSTPNCVCSQGASADHHIEPLRYQGNPTDARERLLAALRAMRGARIITSEPAYVHAEFTSRLLRFVDDVEFLLTDEGLIHVRSASRIGRSDFGVNRKRIEAVRSAFEGG